MDDLPLRWSDGFEGRALAAHWSGGHANESREATIAVRDGVHIEFRAGSEYASAGLVTRSPVMGDFDARARFTVTQPAQGTTFELAAITIDPPAEAALGQEQANEFTRSRVYDVHGAPPYVSSEYDEDDGWRIGWNRGPAISKPDRSGKLIADNHYNRYGRSSAPVAQRPVQGWLRLVRTGTHWAAYRLGDDGLWLLTGEVRHMNLPDPVYLRLAAKHWVKHRSGATTTPANQVTFHRFELRGELPGEDIVAAAPLPAEVALVQELRGCRRCAAFTIENLYGPFPQVDAAGATRVRGFGPPEPAALYGCRKAPVMLIGINPNLPGHFIFPRGSDGADWLSGSYRLLPFFEDDEAYARHYRFGPRPVLRVADAAGLDGLLRQEARSLLVAQQPGDLVPADGARGGSFREPAQRKARLELAFDDGTKQVHEPTWQQGENLAVVRRRFAPGEIIAGRFDAGVIGRPVTAQPMAKADSYYENAALLLASVGKRFPQSRLTLGEDLSLHDAVACASPRWNAEEMPLQTIRDHCVGERRWLHRQVEHSAPEVIVLAGRTALELFAAPEAGTLTPPLAELPSQTGGRDGLFHQVATHGLWWSYRAGAGLRKVRLVVAPHLSYGDNLHPHAYFEEPQWQAFVTAHPQAEQWLRQRVRRVYDSEDRMVLLGGPEDAAAWEALRQLDASAETVLRDLWTDPLGLLGGAVAAELQRLGVGLDAQGHLRRSAGPCGFCDNRLWRFEGGCPYGVSAG